jgi:phosphate transport system protein
MDKLGNRLHFQEEMHKLEQQALSGLDLVAKTIDRVREAVQQQDVELAELVVADDDVVDGLYLQVHQGVLSLLALQAPVATDLRLVAAVLDVIKHIERMGDQCVNVAKLIPLAGNEPPRELDILTSIDRMAAQAKAQVLQAGQAFRSRDVDLAEDLVRQDDEIDKLNRDVFRLALEAGDDADTREWAMTMMLMARAIERIGDNAVDIGEQVAFVVTGLFREFTDASHPEALPPPASPSKS